LSIEQTVEIRATNVRRAGVGAGGEKAAHTVWKNAEPMVYTVVAANDFAFAGT
jgi:hypothetical protein